MQAAPLVIGGVLERPTASNGLELESTYLKGVFRTRGDDQHIVQVVRRLSVTESFPPRLLLQSNIGVSGMRRHRIELIAARSRDVESTVESSGVRFEADASDGAQALQVTLDEDGLRWWEGEIFDVSGAEVLPALQWSIVPGDAEPASAMRRATRVFAVSGTFEGVDVDGFVAIEEVCVAAGRQEHVDDPIPAGNITDVWCGWANAYDDGTLEAGQAAFGANGLGFALLASGGEATVAARVSGSVTSDDEGRPTHIWFDVDGQPWEFVADDRGLALEPLPGPLRQAEGSFRRVGEQRRPVVWWATLEVPVDPA
jgi:hypothetical protein